MVLSMIAAAIVLLLGGGIGIWMVWLITIPASSFAGVLIADLSHRAVGKRRGRYSWLAVAAGIVLGALVVAAIPTILYGMIYLAQAEAIAAQMETLEAEGYEPEMTGEYGPEMGFGPGVPWLFAVAGFTSISWWIYIVAATAAAVGTMRVGRGGGFRFKL